MTWTYGQDPAANNRDAVRYLIGDTNVRSQLRSDEEIAYALLEAGDNVSEAAANTLEQLAIVYARLAESMQLGRRRTQYGDRSAKFRQRAEDVRVEAGVNAAGPLAPQIEVADREAALTDESRTPTQFRVGMMRNRQSYTRPTPSS